jgi:hypothetical protein
MYSRFALSAIDHANAAVRHGAHLVVFRTDKLGWQLPTPPASCRPVMPTSGPMPSASAQVVRRHEAISQVRSSEHALSRQTVTEWRVAIPVSGPATLTGIRHAPSRARRTVAAVETRRPTEASTRFMVDTFSRK